MSLRRYILFFLTLLSFTLQAQQYPVDVQVFATPPYPQSLRGYADTFEEKLQVHFLLKDLSTGGRPFVLRFSLENFQGQVIAQTPDYITPYLVNLSPGVRRTLTNIDFKSLLRYENLYGINEATYNGLLPEGTYFLCLSLYDSATGRPVSNKGRAMIQVRRYSPPVLTMPQKGEVLTKKNAFQHIVFQWMPRDVAPFMQYEFTLKEVWDLALVPEEAFMTGRLVYQTKTFSPALAYTNMLPILLENKRYVWQVRAFTNNPNEQSYFKNNGNSETFYFDLVSHCEAPKFLTAITESTSAQLRWSAQAMMPNQEYPYKVMYREKGKTWKSQKVSMPYTKLTRLKRGRTYIYKVGVACGLNTAHSSSVFGEESYMYSTEQEFTTTEQIDQKSQVQCGVKPEVRIKNTSPLQDNLYPNTTFTAGDFPVTVLNATGNNGVYSGEGYVKVPYLQDTKIKVVFNGIKLNTERQLIEGKLVTTYDGTEGNVVEFSKEIENLTKALNPYLDKVITAIKDRADAKTISNMLKEEIKKIEADMTTGELSLTEEEKASIENFKKLAENKKLIRQAIKAIREQLKEGLPEEEAKKYLVSNFAAPNSSNRDVATRNKSESEGEKEFKETPDFERLQEALQKLEGSAFLKCKACEEEKETSLTISQSKSHHHIGLEGNIYEFSLPIGNTKGNDTDSKGTLYKKYKCYLTTIEALVGSSERLSVIKGGKTKDKEVATFLKEFKEALSQSPKEFLFVRSELLQTLCNVPLFFPTDFCTTTTISEALREHTIRELEDCTQNRKTTQNLSAKQVQIKNTLENIRLQLRDGQGFDWQEEGKVYTLSQEGFLIEEQTPLSAEAIRKGDWRGVETQYARFYRTDKGYIQLIAFGFRKDLPVLKGKKADLVALSEHIQQQTNTFFKPLKEVTDKPQLSPDPDTFADGRRFVISEQASYLRLFSEGTGIVTTLLKTGEVEENVYLEQPTKETYIQAPGVITGSTEVIAQKVTDITSLATTVYGIVVDTQVRRELKEQFIALKEQIGEDPQVLYPLFKEIVLTTLSGNTSEEWASVTNTDTDTGKRSHLATRGTGNVIVNAIVGTQLVKELPQMGKKLAQKAKEIKVRELINSLRRFDVAGEFAKGKKLVEQTIEWGEKKIKLVWKRIGDKIDFGDRNILAKILGTTDNIETHHVIPWNICENNEIVKLAALDGFHPNMLQNGIGLEKYTKLIGEGLHGNHPAYDKYVRSKLENFVLENPNITPEQANKFLQEELIPDLKRKIIDAKNSGMNLNEYFKKINK